MLFKLLIALLLIGIINPTDLSYYELLGITKSATQQEIRQAYKRLAVKLHPDKNPNASEQQKFIKVSEAYDTLKDPEKRRKYDLYGSYPSYTRQYDSTSQAEYNNLYYNGLYANDPYVHTISGNTFYNFLSEGFHFINFYSPFCPPCQNLAEHWKKLAEKYKEIIKIGAVNCKYHNSFCYNSMRIASYPTLLFYPNGKHGNYVYYRNEQNMEALENFIMSYINSQVQVPVVTQIRSASDRPIAYVMGTSWLDRHAVTRIAYRLKGLTLLVIVKDEDLKKKLTKDDYTTVVLKYDGISKEIKSTAEDEILSEIVESLPKSESIDSEKLKEIRSKLRNNQIEPWVLHFTSGTSEKLVIHKLKTKFRDINFGEIDCSRWAQLCLSLQVESPPAWALIKRGGNYQKLTVTSYQELATQLPQALKAHNLQTLSTSEFLRILDGDVNTWIIAVIPQHSSWNQVAEAFTETSLYYQHLNLQFGVMLCSSSSEVYCHRLTNHHPVVIVQNGTRRYTHADNLDQESIIKFIDTLRETADIHISETEVLEISSSKRKHVWLVAFLPPWCGHNCDVLENEWRNVAKKLRILPLVRVGLLRCTSRTGICNNVQSSVIRLYPITSGHSYTVSMEHLSRAPYMWEWALTYIDDSVQQLQWKTFAQVRKELGLHHRQHDSKPWLIYFHSPRCYRCYEMYADFAIAGMLLKNAVNLGKVNCISERAICQEEQIMSYPSLKLYLASTEDRPFTIVQPIVLRDYKTIVEAVNPHIHKDENIKLGLPDIKFDLKHDEF